MQSRPKDVYEIPDEAIKEILDMLLRSPGANESLLSFLGNASSDPLALLYDIWATAHLSDNAINAYWIFVEQRNVNIGVCEDENAPQGLELFASDLHELCIAINTYLETGGITALQKDNITRAQKYYSGFQEINPGHLSVMRGWYEFGHVCNGDKQIHRCIRPDCGRLVVLDKEGYILAGTPEGYHSARCRDKDVGEEFSGIDAKIKMTKDGPEVEANTN